MKLLYFLERKINKTLKILIYIFFFFSLFFLVLKIFFDLNIEFDYKNRELYKTFLSSFWGIGYFLDRYGYGFHYLHSILLFPFLVFKYITGELIFNKTGFNFIGNDENLNIIILYSGKFVSLFSFVLSSYFTYKITYFFTKNKLFSIVPIFFLVGILEVFNYASLFRVDMPLNAFLIGSLYYCIRYIEKYEIKYLLFFIFFSLFAFIIKYQALMYISFLYLLLFLFTIYKNNKEKNILKGGVFFVFIFSILNFNYYQLVKNILLRFDFNSDFMKLNNDEIIHKSYSFIDRLGEISNNIYQNFGEFNYYLLIIGLILFIISIFLKRIKFKYILILVVPFLINYYSHLFLTYILNARHYLLMYYLLIIFSCLGYYFLFSVIGKEKLRKIFLYIFILFVLLINYYRIFYNFSIYYTKDEKIKYNYVTKNIKNNEKILFIQEKDFTPIPFGFQYLYNSDLYRIIGKDDLYEKNNVYGDNYKITNDLILKYNQLILLEQTYKKYKDLINSNYNLKFEFEYNDDKYYIFQKKINAQKTQ